MTAMKVPKDYAPIDKNEFQRFDDAMTKLLRVPYSAVQKELNRTPVGMTRGCECPTPQPEML